MNVTEFEVAVPESSVDDLRSRLSLTRWPDAETVSDWSQGAPLSFVRSLAEHWEHKYDWRSVESRLNALPQFRAEIDGLGIHFLHVRSPHAGATPLLLTHGWPGSVLEFLEVLEPLTNPADPADAFHVVVPSLPGYGFSDKPTETGWGVERIARAWSSLMTGLGYERYAAHGGDWGSFVTAELGHVDASRLIGIHLTMVFAGPPEEQVELTQRDYAGLAALKEFQAREAGYSAIQMTKPQTIGYGLHDSPVALLAWIAEKYYSWTDHDRPFEELVPVDKLLDAVSIYWFTGTATSAARLYWESHNRVPMHQVSVPTGVTIFPKDARMPKAWIEARFADLRYWNDAEAGGHFPGIERPDVLVSELRTFFRHVR
ncbi:epoxide hydrolase [Lentzea sp. NEAU-D13]|uniref:Epoxide hydrolase n=1 Tax=Lentzea alba TaxID=2714351 RepID=A0A7C9RX16_9PSEU|nr:epoxide hydrolase family protein [Lentzea alba]NGY62802.1 epoxide hydrolase [Lentzea alba]